MLLDEYETWWGNVHAYTARAFIWHNLNKTNTHIYMDRLLSVTTTIFFLEHMYYYAFFSILCMCIFQGHSWTGGCALFQRSWRLRGSPGIICATYGRHEITLHSLLAHKFFKFWVSSSGAYMAKGCLRKIHKVHLKSITMLRYECWDSQQLSPSHVHT